MCICPEDGKRYGSWWVGSGRFWERQEGTVDRVGRTVRAGPLEREGRRGLEEGSVDGE